MNDIYIFSLSNGNSVAEFGVCHLFVRRRDRNATPAHQIKTITKSREIEIKSADRDKTEEKNGEVKRKQKQYASKWKRSCAPSIMHDYAFTQVFFDFILLKLGTLGNICGSDMSNATPHLRNSHLKALPSYARQRAFGTRIYLVLPSSSFRLCVHTIYRLFFICKQITWKI